MDVERKLYIGVVEENIDPKRQGRIKVRVQTLYHQIKTEEIPWASPFAGLAGKEYQVPAIGKLVNVMYFQNDLYDPYYIFSENYNINLQNKLKDLSDEDYVRFVSLLFDDRTQIFSDSSELTLDYFFNKITVSKWGINLELKDKKQILNLGGKGATQDAVLGTRFFEWMDKFIDELSNPYSLTGNLLAPVLKPKLDKLCREYKAIRSSKDETFLSKHVKIIDNNAMDTLTREIIPNQNDIDLILSPDSMSEELMNRINRENSSACGEISSSLPKGGIGSIPDPDDVPEPSDNQAVFKVVRYKFLTDRTLGKLYINNKYYCDTLEDTYRDLTKEKKVYGQTAIPFGTYKLTFGPTGLSRKTAPSGKLPLVNDVPYFSGIRIHRWGKPQDTEGCLLVGNLNEATNTLINYAKVSDNINEICESYQNKGVKMTIVYTKDQDDDTTATTNKTLNGTEYVEKDNPNITPDNTPCTITKPDSSWSTNLELNDFKINGEPLKYEGDLLITAEQLRYIMPQASKSNIEKFLIPINITLKKFNIDTTLKISAFLSQIATESENLKFTKELGGDSYFKKYEGRKDLGNDEKGDGIKYHGRGIIQITGKINYKQQATAFGVDFISTPELLEQPLWASLSAGFWWKKRESLLNPAIERKDIKRISKIVNGGYNGLSKRVEFWNRALKLFNIT